jgi:hypothetical protein
LLMRIAGSSGKEGEGRGCFTPNFLVGALLKGKG